MNVAIRQSKDIKYGVDKQETLAIRECLNKRGYSSEVIHSIKQVANNHSRFTAGLMRVADYESQSCAAAISTCYLEKMGVPFLDGFLTNSLTRLKNTSHILMKNRNISQPEWMFIKANQNPAMCQ